LCIVCLLVGEWLTRFWGFYWWSHYPINFVFPSTMIPGALIMDTVLLLTRNWMITALVGGGAFGLLFYPGNWPIFGPTHLPLVAEGVLLSLADYTGFLYVRTGTPEYVRLIEQGSLGDTPPSLPHSSPRSSPCSCSASGGILASSTAPPSSMSKVPVAESP
jgi:methane/ammonia monooxygenase subunit A